MCVYTEHEQAELISLFKYHNTMISQELMLIHIHTPAPGSYSEIVWSNYLALCHLNHQFKWDILQDIMCFTMRICLNIRTKLHMFLTTHRSNLGEERERRIKRGPEVWSVRGGVKFMWSQWTGQGNKWGNKVKRNVLRDMSMKQNY